MAKAFPTASCQECCELKFCKDYKCSDSSKCLDFDPAVNSGGWSGWYSYPTAVLSHSDLCSLFKEGSFF